MFQSVTLSNPLREYSHNPNVNSNAESEDVPSLSQSQQKLEKRYRTTTNIIYLIIAILLAVLALTIGVNVYTYVTGITIFDQPPIVEDVTEIVPEVVVVEEKVQVTEEQPEGEGFIKRFVDKIKEVTSSKPDSTRPLTAQEKKQLSECSECLDYFQLKKKASEDIAEAERYVREKVAQATRKPNVSGANIPSADPLVGLTLEKVPILQSKLAELAGLNKTFNEDLQKALEKERGVRELKDQFNDKVKTIDELKRRAIDAASRVAGDDAHRERASKNVKELDDQIAAQRKKNQEEKNGVEEIIAGLRNGINENLRGVNVTTERELDRAIDAAKRLIDNSEGEKQRCKTSVDTDIGELQKATHRYVEIQRRLGVIDEYLIRRKWVEHVLNTIKRLEEIRAQLIDLKNSQLKEAKENIEALTNSLQKKEDELRLLFAQGNEDGSIRYEEVRYIREQNQQIKANWTTYEFRSRVTNFDKAITLSLFIEKEKNLLSVWALEQFKTLNLSTHEINNVTNTIENYRASIVDQKDEYLKYQYEKETLSKEILIVQTTMNRLEDDIKTCELLIDNSVQVVADREVRLKKLQQARGDIDTIHGRIKNQQNHLLHVEKEGEDALDNLIALRDKAYDVLNNFANDKANSQWELHDVTNQINEKILAYPQPEVVEARIIEHRQTVKITNELYADLVKIVNEIVRTL